MGPAKAEILSFMIIFALGGCAAIENPTPEKKRQAILSMRNDTLSTLYKIRPDVQAQIAKAPGYAVFSNANINVIFASFSGGHGVVSSKKTNPVFMQMGEIGIGLGLGIKDFRAVFIFHNQEALTRFVESGWEFGGHIDAAAKAGDKGAATGGEVLLDGITIYQLTESGLALQATLKGTKYWKDSELN